VENIASVDFPRAVGFVLNTDIGEDPQLADTLFGIFEERPGLDFASISTDELELLLKKLVEVEEFLSNVGDGGSQAATL